MPNWADVEITVKMPTRGKEAFVGLFLGWDDEVEKPRFFARTFINNVEVIDIEDGMSIMEISCDCAWSIYSCWVDGYPQKSNGKCITMEEACKEFEVESLEATSEEWGMMFREYYNYDKTDGAEISCKDISQEEYIAIYGEE